MRSTVNPRITTEKSTRLLVMEAECLVPDDDLFFLWEVNGDVSSLPEPDNEDGFVDDRFVIILSM